MDKRIFDYDALLSQYDGDKEFAAILTTTYLEEAPLFIDEMRESMEVGDHHTFNRGAHSLKSSAANVKAEEVRALAQQMEAMTKNEINDDINDFFDKLVEANKLLIEVLEKNL